MGLHEPEKVNVEQITSSPVFTPRDISARWIAAVPELTASAWLMELYPAIFFSNSRMAGPVGAIQLESKALLMNSSSAPHMWGGERYIRFFMPCAKVFGNILPG